MKIKKDIIYDGDDKERTKGVYLFKLRSLFVLRILSKPNRSSRIYEIFLWLLCGMNHSHTMFESSKLVYFLPA